MEIFSKNLLVVELFKAIEMVYSMEIRNLAEMNMY